MQMCARGAARSEEDWRLCGEYRIQDCRGSLVLETEIPQGESSFAYTAEQLDAGDGGSCKSKFLKPRIGAWFGIYGNEELPHFSMYRVNIGDLIQDIRAGEFTMSCRSAEAILDFNDCLGELPDAFRGVMLGNYDFVL